MKNIFKRRIHQNLLRTGRTFVAALIETQMFNRFIQERLSNPDHPDVVFFNDSIIAKKNRSKKKALVSKRKQTLFLLDDSGRVSAFIFDILQR